MKITHATLRKMKRGGEKIACLTAYDASFATLLEDAGVEVILVGDSLGMVVQGRDSTVSVRMKDMLYHTRWVAGAVKRALLIADMPFMSYAESTQALRNAARLMRAGAHMVKLEGGGPQVEIVSRLSAVGIPVCAHLGLQPQLVHKSAGYYVQGREEQEAAGILDNAAALEKAGADMLLLECVPSALAARVQEQVGVPVIGIGAGADCDGQILVLYDMLGITPGKVPRFAKNFMAEHGDIPKALRGYVEAVKSGAFPDTKHSFS